MKNLKSRLAIHLLSALCLLTGAYGQITPTGDAYTNSTTPTTNYGAKTLLDVDAASQISYIQFDLASIPAGASVSQATLKLYVNSVTTAGGFNVDYVAGSWSEGTIDYSNAPPLGASIASGVEITTAEKNHYVLINITPALVAWLDGSQTNDGIALVANGSFNATFDSKENTTTSHPPELDVVFAGGGGGTITGVLTGAGSGLTGGGTSGTLNLSLLNTCAASQVLQWNGSGWGCASVGAGTITGVTAGTDLTGGGASGNVTLNLDTTKVPQLAAANTFTGSQTVNGNLSATGVVTGSGYQIGSTLFDYGSSGNGNAFLGFAGNTTMTGSGNTAVGALALYSNTTGATNTATGYGALTNNTTGLDNTAVGFVALKINTSGKGNTAIGEGSGITVDTSYLTGSNNTFLGANANLGTGTLSNATAIGANAEVGESNAMVLGSINGVNGATANTNVGIGTTTPGTTLDIVSSSTYQPLFVESSSTFGTWMELNNTSAGGKNWAILSAASGNGEGSGNLGITNFTGTSTIYLEGNVNVTGNLTKQSGSFKIDHPLDPASKYLYHSFVESPDMMNVYNGNVITNRRGFATVVLPAYFEALNRDFRYQLTVIGQFAQAIVAREISGNRFTIRTSKPGVKVSWQVTGIRHDAYADAHRIQVEEEKPPQEQGRYMHPELFGASPAQAIGTRLPAPAATADALNAPLSRLAPGK
jgi:hypothetical protein